jgi:hypothetical protein
MECNKLCASEEIAMIARIAGIANIEEQSAFSHQHSAGKT